MNKQAFDINSLRVASPCSVGWDTMTGDERTRHCDLCSLNVYNVSTLTADEVKDLVLKSEGRICMRMYRRADGTLLTRDCPVGLRAVRKRVTAFAGAAFAGFIGLFSVSFAQGQDRDSTDTAPGITRTANLGTAGRLSGKIVDPAGVVIPDARIVVVQGKQEWVAISNAEGRYYLPMLAAGTYDIRITAPGFDPYALKDFQVNSSEAVELNITLRVGALTGVVICLDDIKIDKSTTNVKKVIDRNIIDRIPH